ncbi:unnamed protein product [Rotaria sordida]|uniref:Nocturnin n=1 Tax=Rotaria sordida TaxID=392033 RepID=A0A819QP91_9BILA|nr:unnamed protein product [Rotaria sordida]CAF4034303.1 unnamed protein product [Rotaria sordida]
MATSATTDSISYEIKQYIKPESLKREFDVNISRTKTTIHVLQWNVLAQALSYTKGNFVRVTDDIVDFDTRKWRILEQIIIRRPDLCALQEIFAALDLEHKPASNKIVFIGTHFKSKKEFKTSRTYQAQAIVEYIRKNYSTRQHVIVAGDFNGEIDEPFYSEFLNFGLRSAYRTKMNDKEPTFTTWKFKGRDGTEREQCKAIDYIFYNPKGFTPKAILQFPNKSDIGPNALPSIHYPSDHLALEVVFDIEQ